MALVPLSTRTVNCGYKEPFGDRTWLCLRCRLYGKVKNCPRLVEMTPEKRL